MNSGCAKPNPDPLVIAVSHHRLNFVGPYFEEEGGRIGRVWRGMYYGPPESCLPVLSGRGPDNVIYDLQIYQAIIRRRKMITITISLNIILHKEQRNLLDPPPFTYPGITSTHSYNTSSNLNIELRGIDRYGDIYCGDKN